MTPSELTELLPLGVRSEVEALFYEMQDVAPTFQELVIIWLAREVVQLRSQILHQSRTKNDSYTRYYPTLPPKEDK